MAPESQGWFTLRRVRVGEADTQMQPNRWLGLLSLPSFLSPPPSLSNSADCQQTFGTSYWRVLLRLRTFVDAFKRSRIHRFALFFRFLRHAAPLLFLAPCNDRVSTPLHGRVHACARNRRILRSPHISSDFVRHFRGLLSFLYVDFSSSTASRIVGSRPLSRSREFRFSCIGEIRRIDGNLISRERTTALKDFDRVRGRIRARPSVCVRRKDVPLESYGL